MAHLRIFAPSWALLAFLSIALTASIEMRLLIAGSVLAHFRLRLWPMLCAYQRHLIEDGYTQGWLCARDEVWSTIALVRAQAEAGRDRLPSAVIQPTLPEKIAQYTTDAPRQAGHQLLHHQSQLDGRQEP